MCYNKGTKEREETKMFIRIEDNIININEIRNVEMYTHSSKQGSIHIHFKDCRDSVIFSGYPLAECKTIMDTLTDACVTKNN